jgi:hypothetical protein
MNVRTITGPSRAMIIIRGYEKLIGMLFIQFNCLIGQYLINAKP